MSNPYTYVVLITLLSFSTSFEIFGNLQDTSVNCTSSSGYCSDCLTSVLCNGDSVVSVTKCSDEEACKQFSTFSTCVDSFNVPECECSTADEIFLDLYDDDKFIICDNYVRHIEQCEENEFFDTDTKRCEEIQITTAVPTTPPVTRSPLCEPDKRDVVKVSCTQYQICYSDGAASDIRDCPLGCMFNEDSEDCEFYAPFSCSDREDNFWADTNDCSIYYLCIEGEIQGGQSVCPEGNLFDDDKHTCVPESDSTCIPVKDCGICPDDETFIAIDCYNYYKCENNDEYEDGDLKFIPVIYTCPETTCFNQDSTYCEFISFKDTLKQNPFFGVATFRRF